MLAAVAELHAWLLANQRSVVVGSRMAEAIDYALRRWPALQRYAPTGSLPINNKPIENAICRIAIRKKTWPFVRSER